MAKSRKKVSFRIVLRYRDTFMYQRVVALLSVALVDFSVCLHFALFMSDSVLC